MGMLMASLKNNHSRSESDYKIYYLTLLAIVIFALAYSITFTDGPSYFGDDVTYLNLAYNVIHGNFVESGYIFSIRLMQILPIALSYKLFGVSILSSSAWDITSYIGIIIVSFFMAKELFNNLAAVSAAALAAFFPLIVVYSSTINEDIPLAFLTSLALLSILYAQRRKSGMWYAASGILLVASFLVSPEAAAVGIIVVLYLAIEVICKRIKIDRVSMHFAYGIAIALIILMAFNYLNANNPLITFDVNLHFYSAVGGINTIPSTNVDPMFYFNVMFPYHFYSQLSSAMEFQGIAGISIPNMVQYVISTDQNTSTGFYFYVLVAAIIYLAATKEKRAYFPLFFLIAGFLYLEFGPMHISLSPFEYLLSYRLDRFLMIIAVPLVVTLGMAVAKLVQDNALKSKYITSVFAFVIIAFLIATSVPINLNWHQVVVYQRYDQIAISNYLSGVSSFARIYFPNSDPSINIYSKFNNDVRFIPYASFVNCSIFPSGSYVVLPSYPPIAATDNITSCPSWQLLLSPSPQGQFPEWIQGEGKMALAKLYYVK